MKKLKLAILATAMAATSSIGWAQDGKAALVANQGSAAKPDNRVSVVAL